MKVMKVLEPGKLICEEEPVPKLQNDTDVLIRVKAAGICGSDIAIYRGTSPVATYPRVIGHEFAGEVTETGAGCRRIRTGDHVTVNPVISCGTCRVCRKGRGNVCAHLRVIGVHEDGGYREFVRVPEANCFAVEKSLPWERAALVEPYTVAAQVAQRGGVEAGDRVLILGAGQIALTVLQVCKLLGAYCIITDLVDQRLEKALSFGADKTINTSREDIRGAVASVTEGIGADIAVDAACVGVTLRQAVECVRPAGVVVTMGFADRPVPATELQITKNELEIRGSRLNCNQFPRVIDWVQSGRLDPTRIVTDRIPFTDVLRGIEKIKQDPAHTMKVVLTF